MFRTGLPGGWGAIMLVEHGRRPIHDHSVPKRERPKKRLMLPVYNPHTGVPFFGEDGRQLLVAVKKVMTDEHGRPVYGGDGKLVFEDAYTRSAPMTKPECTVVTLLLFSPENEASVYVGWSWLHWKDRKEFKRKIGYRIARSRALRRMNRSEAIPGDVKEALSFWCRLVTSRAISSPVAGLEGEDGDEDRDEVNEQGGGSEAGIEQIAAAAPGGPTTETVVDVPVQQSNPPERVSIETTSAARVIGNRRKADRPRHEEPARP